MTLETAPAISSQHVPRWGEHAIVVGASMAGMLTARVLADAFDRVTLLERDPLPKPNRQRRGIPQDAHVHVMLEAGRATLQSLFPGFSSELEAAGGLELDASTHVRHFEGGDFLDPGEEPLVMYSASRPLLDGLVRNRIVSNPRIRLRPRWQLSTFRAGHHGVTGVVPDAGNPHTMSLDAELVVDATGRTSRTPAWLAEHGYPRPQVDTVAVDVTYSSAKLDRPPGDRRGFLIPPAPSRRTGAAIVPIEGGAWQVTLIGVHDQQPPAEVDAFYPYARTLPVPDVADVLTTHRWRSEATMYRFPSNLRRRYGSLPMFPRGLLVIGDAVASFNPIYGQGMSVAALQARHLHGCLRDRSSDSLAPRYFRAIERVIDTAWRMTVSGDFRFPETAGRRPRGTGVLHRYLDRVIRTAHRDPVVGRALYRVLRLEREPRSLVYPPILWRVLRPSGGA